MATRLPYRLAHRRDMYSMVMAARLVRVSVAKGLLSNSWKPVLGTPGIRPARLPEPGVFPLELLALGELVVAP